MTLMGYANRLSARPGETIELRVSCSAPEFVASLVRFRGSLWPKRPIEPEQVESDFAGAWPGRVQPVPIGSWVSIDLAPTLDVSNGIAFGCHIFPTMPVAGKVQCIASLLGPDGTPNVTLILDEAGHLCLNSAEATLSRSSAPLLANRWYSVAAAAGGLGVPSSLNCIMAARSWLPAQEITCEEGPIATNAGEIVTILLAAMRIDVDGRPQHCFNGKIANPMFATQDQLATVRDQLTGGEISDVSNLVAAWDFSREHHTDRVIEITGRNNEGVCHNQPMRAVVGPSWTGREVNPKLLPDEYDAIAFHEDDLADCGWDTDITWTVPDTLRQGVYGVRLAAEGAVDHIPFYIHSSPAAQKPPVLYLAPTNTYLAYGNERLFDGIEAAPDFIERSVRDPIVMTERDHFLMEHPEIGSSVYDVHPDRSGICYSSRLRPVVTMRPEASSWTTGHPRHFSADLFLIEWLEAMNFTYDVATDEDLHVEGIALLDDYAVIVTGSHPEYWTEPALDALESYLARGGRCMYLGGNGFYWVTGTSEAAPHVIEVRRGINGTRAWTSHPGEIHLSTTGELGGLWRNRGRFPNRMVGVGFTSQGWGGAPGYQRLPDSESPSAAFVFEGIGLDESLGDFGLVMGGASGDELDRFDVDLGSPAEALRLATTEGAHTDYYQLVIEDCTFMLAGRGGTEDMRVRSDIVLLEDPSNGGAVFSVGSINWIGSLMWNGGENAISRMTANVLRRFQENLPA